MIVVGLDLSLTNAGIAVLTDGRPTLLRSVGHGGKNGASYRQRSLRVRGQSCAVMDAIGPMCAHGGSATCIKHRDNPCSGLEIGLAVIEGPEAFDSFGHAFDRGALWHGVFAALDAKHVPIAVVNPTTLKVWATGKGDADKGVRGKPMMRAAVTGWYPQAPILDDDQCDALALATIGAFHLGDPVPFEVKDRHHGALEKVEWPVSV